MSHSGVAALTLQDFDLVAVGILHEEEPRHKRSIAMELLDGSGIQSRLAQALMLTVEIVGRDGEVAVAAAVRVRLRASMIDGQLDLEVVFGVLEIDKGKS